MKNWNWLDMVDEWNTLLSAACRAVRCAVRRVVDDDMVHYWCRLIFKLDAGSIDAWGLTDLLMLIRGECRQPAPAYVMVGAERALRSRLEYDVFVSRWYESL